LNPLGTGAIAGLGQQGVARIEMRVKAGVCQAGLFHDVGHASAIIALRRITRDATSTMRSCVSSFVGRRGLGFFRGHDCHHILFPRQLFPARSRRRLISASTGPALY
jgi:hypothetical protein